MSNAVDLVRDAMHQAIQIILQSRVLTPEGRPPSLLEYGRNFLGFGNFLISVFLAITFQKIILI